MADELDVYKEWLGIPEGPRPPDHYSLLRLVMYEDSVDKIRNNYKKLNAHVRKYASGKYSIRSQELLNELAKAMLCLEDMERKREYDASLGRVFEEEFNPETLRSMESVLFDRKLLTREQAKEAHAFADKLGLEFRDALVQMKLVEPAAAAEALAVELGLPYVDLADMIPDDDVLDRVPRNVVKTNSILPLFVDDDQLLVACVNPPTHELEDELRLRFQQRIRCVLATPLAINQGIAKYYAPGMRQEVAPPAQSKKVGAKAAAKSGKPAPAPKKRAPGAPLSEAELKEKRLLGYMIPFWALIICVLLDQFVLVPKTWSVPFLSTFIIPPLVGLFIWKVYFPSLK